MGGGSGFRPLAGLMVDSICSVISFPFGGLPCTLRVTPVGTLAWAGRGKAVDGAGGGKGY